MRLLAGVTRNKIEKKFCNFDSAGIEFAGLRLLINAAWQTSRESLKLSVKYPTFIETKVCDFYRVISGMVVDEGKYSNPAFECRFLPRVGVTESFSSLLILGLGVAFKLWIETRMDLKRIRCLSWQKETRRFINGRLLTTIWRTWSVTLSIE